jgi:hypothetical protein
MAITLNGTTGITTPALDTSGDVTFADNDKAIFGAGSDLQIFHDGSNSYIDDAGNGDMLIRGSARILLRKAGTTENMIRAEADSYVKLYFDNAEKLATTATGIDVTGDITPTGGVYLGGTGSANLLDDYEEGTWTPVITAEGSSAASITVNTATYTKVGRLVSLVFMVTIDSISGTGSSNAIELTGMPFTINDASSGGANVGYTNLTASMSGTLAFQGNTTTKYRIVNLNGLTGLNASDHLTSGSILRAQFIYHSA